MARPVLTPLDGDGIIDTAELVDLAVTAAKLAADAVETAKILNANVTTAKLATGAVTTAKITDANVTTAKIADANVTDAKLRTSAGVSVIGRASSGSGEVADVAATDTFQVLRRGATSLNWGKIQADYIDDLQVTEAKLAPAVLSTAWADLTFATGWGTPGSGTRLRYKKIGNVLFLSGGARRASGTDTLVGTLPSGFRPSSEFRIPITGNAPDAEVLVIASSGAVSVQAGLASTLNITVGSPVPL